MERRRKRRPRKSWNEEMMKTGQRTNRNHGVWVAEGRDSRCELDSISKFIVKCSATLSFHSSPAAHVNVRTH
jgi:hypothetical protein